MIYTYIILHIMFTVIMSWAASIDGHLSSLVACHCTDLYLFNLFVHLANKLSLSLLIMYSTRALNLHRALQKQASRCSHQLHQLRSESDSTAINDLLQECADMNPPGRNSTQQTVLSRSGF